MHTSSLMLTASTMLAVAAGSVLAQDWTNAGGNQGRNGLSPATGPDSPTLRWSGGRSSIIAWQPVTEGNRMFVVRQTGFPPSGEPNGSPIVAYDITDGTELWTANIPFETGDWTTWIAGVSNGQVYASRGGNGASVSAPLYALDAATGGVVWTTSFEINAGAYDGVVFADDGDPIIASFRTIWRINAEDGAVVWSAPRTGSVSGNTGGAIGNGGVYVVDAVVGGHAVKKFDLATGAFLYEGPVMAGFTAQNTPMVSPDGTIYFSRTQNNAAVDFFYAFDDTGSAILERWNVPAGWSTGSEFGVMPDGSVLMMGPGDAAGLVIERRAAADGALIASSEPIPADFLSPHFAVDAQGTIYFSNGAFSNGRLFAFDGQLNELWSESVANINIGGPALAADGTLIVVGNGTQVRAYYTEPQGGCPACAADYDQSGGVDGDDITAFFTDWESGAACGDVDGSGGIDGDDIPFFFERWQAGGC